MNDFNIKPMRTLQNTIVHNISPSKNKIKG